MSDTWLIVILIILVIIMLLLNIFLVYIPLNKIENALIDIDNKVETAAVVIRPVIDKVLPLLESL